MIRTALRVTLSLAWCECMHFGRNVHDHRSGHASTSRHNDSRCIVRLKVPTFRAWTLRSTHRTSNCTDLKSIVLILDSDSCRRILESIEMVAHGLHWVLCKYSKTKHIIFSTQNSIDIQVDGWCFENNSASFLREQNMHIANADRA